MAENKGDQFANVPPAPASKAHADTLLGDLHQEFRADMRELSVAGAARVREKTVEVAASVDGSLESDVRRNTEEEVIFSNFDRDELEKNIRETMDYREKLLAVRNNLRALGGICHEISNLRGWPMLSETVKDLPSRELIDQVYWKQKFDWSDKQLDALNAQKQDQLVPPKDLEDTFLALHDLLVASQAVLFELQKQGSKVVSQEDKPPERRILFTERLERIHVLAEEWRQLMGQYPGGPKRFPEAVAKALGVKHALNVKGFVNELAEQGKQHEWKGEVSKGDKSAAVKKLSFLEKQVAAARDVVSAASKSSRGSLDSKTTTTQPVRQESAPSSKEGMMMLGEQLTRWDSLVAEIEALGGKERLEQSIAKKLEEKRLGTIKWESLHQQVRKTLGEIEAGTSKKDQEKQQTFLKGNTSFYREFLALAEQLRDELRIKQGPVKTDDDVIQSGVAASLSTLTKGRSASPTLPKVTSPDTRPSETHLAIEESLGKLRRRDRELWYRNQAGDVLVIRPTRNVEAFELWRPDGSMRIHHYRELATLLYAEQVTFEGNRQQKAGAPYGEKNGGDSLDESKQSPDTVTQTLSPEGERQVSETVALLEQQRDRWRARIEAIGTQQEFDTLTREAANNGSWTTVPGFVVGNALVRLLNERSITDPAVVQVIKDQAFVLQRELNPLYLAKRDEFYPPRTSDAKASKQEAPQSSVNSEVWTTNKLLDQVADGSAIMLTSPDRKNREAYRRSGESFFSPAEKGQSPVAVPIDVILTKLNDPKKPWSFVGRQLIDVTKSEKEIYQGESVMRLPRSGEVVFYSRAVNKNDKEYKEGEDQEFEMSVRFDGPNTYSARDGRNGTHQLGTLNQKEMEEVLMKEGWKVVGVATTEAPKQEAPQQLSREQMQNFLKQILGSARSDLIALFVELGTEGGLKDVTKRKVELNRIFSEAMLPAIVEQIAKKVALDETLRTRLETLLKTLPNEVV